MIWFEMLRNHSQIHVWFTYRSIPLALGIVAAALVIPLPDASVRDDDPAESADDRIGADVA